MNSRTLIAALIALALGLGLAAGAWYELRQRPPTFCEISGRPIQANMLTRIKVDGERLYACCARCGLTLGAQTGQRVEILEVTDYVSGRRLPAQQAYFVEGSQVEVCSTPRLKVDQTRTPYVRLFDRCSPSLLAFAGEADARDFVRHYGGRLKRLNELMQEAAAGRPPGRQE